METIDTIRNLEAGDKVQLLANDEVVEATVLSSRLGITVVETDDYFWDLRDRPVQRGVQVRGYRTDGWVDTILEADMKRPIAGTGPKSGTNNR